VTLFYISNRDNEFRVQTSNMLDRLEIGRPGEKYLKLQRPKTEENKTPGDKTARRKEVETSLRYCSTSGTTSGTSTKTSNSLRTPDRSGSGEGSNRASE